MLVENQDDRTLSRSPSPGASADKTTDLTETVGADETSAPDGAATALPGSSSPSRYEVLDELGRGGMGVVCRARDLRTGRIVALKTMRRPDGTSLDYFKREFRHLQGVSHPNLVQLHELESDGRDWLLTME